MPGEKAPADVGARRYSVRAHLRSRTEARKLFQKELRGFMRGTLKAKPWSEIGPKSAYERLHSRVAASGRPACGLRHRRTRRHACWCWPHGAPSEITVATAVV